MPKIYGEMSVETDLKDMTVCRDIVKELLDFGINQKQILQVIYLLSLEIENREAMLYISKAVKDVMEGNTKKESALSI